MKIKASRKYKINDEQEMENYMNMLKNGNKVANTNKKKYKRHDKHKKGDFSWS